MSGILGQDAWSASGMALRLAGVSMMLGTTQFTFSNSRFSLFTGSGVASVLADLLARHELNPLRPRPQSHCDLQRLGTPRPGLRLLAR